MSACRSGWCRACRCASPRRCRSAGYGRGVLCTLASRAGRSRSRAIRGIRPALARPTSSPKRPCSRSTTPTARSAVRQDGEIAAWQALRGGAATRLRCASGARRRGAAAADRPRHLADAAAADRRSCASAFPACAGTCTSRRRCRTPERGAVAGLRPAAARRCRGWPTPTSWWRSMPIRSGPARSRFATRAASPRGAACARGTTRAARLYAVEAVADPDRRQGRPPARAAARTRSRPSRSRIARGLGRRSAATRICPRRRARTVAAAARRSRARIRARAGPGRAGAAGRDPCACALDQCAAAAPRSTMSSRSTAAERAARRSPSSSARPRGGPGRHAADPAAATRSTTRRRDLGFAEALAQGRSASHLGRYCDETAALCQWHLPRAHAARKLVATCARRTAPRASCSR